MHRGDGRAACAPATQRTMANLIEDYGLIGDCETAALVSCGGSVDWLCWPRFDSGARLSQHLLGSRRQRTLEHRARAHPEPRVRRRYRGNTLILETTFETTDGTVDPHRLHAVARQGTSHLIRIVQGRAWACEDDDGTRAALRLWRSRALGHASRRRTVSRRSRVPTWWSSYAETPIEADGFRHRGEFFVSAEERVAFSLRYGPSYLPAAADDRRSRGA